MYLHTHTQICSTIWMEDLLQRRLDEDGIMHSLNKYLLSIYYVPGTFLGIEKAVSNIHLKKKNPCTHEVYWSTKIKSDLLINLHSNRGYKCTQLFKW